MSRFGPRRVLDDIREAELIAHLLDVLLRLYLKIVRYWHLCLRFLARMLHEGQELVRRICGHEESGTWSLFKRR